MPMRKIAIGRETLSTPVCKVVKGDKASQIIRFSIPRVEGGVDLSTLLWTIEEINSNEDKRIVYLGAATKFDNHLLIDWTLDELTAAAAGTTYFKLKGLDSQDNSTIIWQSADRCIQVLDSKVDVTEDTELSSTELNTAETYLISLTGKLANLQEEVTAAEAKIPDIQTAATQAQVVVAQAQTAISDANEAIESANTAAEEAATAAQNAADSTSQLDSALASTMQVTADAQTAISNANTATTAANAAADRAGTSASNADKYAELAGTAAAVARSAATDANQAYQNLQAAVKSGAFDGKDGEDGDDGFSPVVSYHATTNGYLLTIVDAEGSKSFEIKNGENYTLTDADINNIAMLVIEHIGISKSDIEDETERAKQAESNLGDLITQTKSELNTAITDRIAAVVASAPEAFNTLKEIADWIGSGDVQNTTAASMLADINELKAKVAEKFTVSEPLVYENNNLSISMADDDEINEMMTGW